MSEEPVNYNSGAEAEVRANVDVERLFMGRIYNWMAGGLAITALTAWQVAESMIHNKQSLFRSPGVFLGLFIAELILVMVLSAAVRKLSPMVAALCFIGFSLLNGMSLAPVFLVYTTGSIFAAFFTCAGMFGVTSMYGYMTKSNLSSVGSFCFMGLIGLIIASVVNFFLRNAMMDYILSFIGVAVFLGLTAWDTQKLRSLAAGRSSEDVYSDDMKKLAVVGALMLYLDFINIFLYLLRLFGNRRS